MTKAEKEMISKNLREQLEEHIKNREFEKATIVRDQIKELEEGSQITQIDTD
jgi:protein-arginine kinase activator protein McsA